MVSLGIPVSYALQEKNITAFIMPMPRQKRFLQALVRKPEVVFAVELWCRCEWDGS